MSPRWDMVLTKRPAPDIGTVPGFFRKAIRLLITGSFTLHFAPVADLASPRFSYSEFVYCSSGIGVCTVWPRACCCCLLGSSCRLPEVKFMYCSCCRLRRRSSDPLSYMYERRLLFRPHTGSSRVSFDELP